jgi:hypothetical protein
MCDRPLSNRLGLRGIAFHLHASGAGRFRLVVGDLCRVRDVVVKLSMEFLRILVVEVDLVGDAVNGKPNRFTLPLGDSHLVNIIEILDGCAQGHD